MTHPHIPPLLPPDRMPKVRTVDDLLQHWRALMGELGFGYRAIWLALFEADGQAIPALPRIDDVPARPDPTLIRNLVAVVEGVLDHPDASAAFLLSRPGTATLTEDDHAWVARLARAAADRGVRLHPTLVATDEAVVVPPGRPRAA